MLYSTRCKILVTGMVMLICGGLSAETNPFSVNIETEKKSIEGDVTQVLKINLSSRSIDEEKYQLTVEIPKGNVSVMEGKKIYTGVIRPLRSENFYLTIRLLSPGDGEIRVKVFNYLDDKEPDTQNVRTFYSNYSVTKNVNPAQGPFSLSVAATSEKTDAEKTADQGGQADQVSGQVSQKDTELQEGLSTAEEKQKFVVDPKNRYNNFIRIVLFVLSFLLLGWLVNRIIYKRS